MTRQGVNRQRYEDRDGGSNAPLLILIAIAIFGAAVLLMYIAIAAPQAGTAMGAVKDVMRGLGGSLCYALPLVLAWAGVLCVLSARGRQLSTFKMIADTLMILAFFAGVHVFFARRIMVERMTIAGFSNFVAKSYGYGQGGGAIGALLAWPMYRYLGEAGGFIAAALVILLCLTATGRISRLAGWLSDRAEAREQAKQSEQTFDEFAEVQRPRRRPVSRDPMSEGIATGGTQRKPRPQRQPQREATVGVPKKRRPQAAQADPIAETPVKPAQPKKKAPAKRKKLYIEDVPQEAPVEPIEDKPDQGKYEALFDPFDDFEPMPAEEVLKESDDSKRRFKPDRPKAVEKPKPAEPVIEDIPEDAHLNDDLKIEPEQYETPDDDVPFDIPSRQKVKKEDLPKIRREEMKVEMDDDAPEYNYPPIDLLEMGEMEDVSRHNRRDREKGQELVETLRSFGIETTLTGIAHGPAVTRFEVQPAAGIKVSRITSLSDDIAMNLEAMSVRIEAPIPGKKAVGVEIDVYNPSGMPEPNNISEVYEPYIHAQIITKADFIGPVIKLCMDKRGQLKNQNYLTTDRIEITFDLPLGEVVFDFYDKLKSISKGYASFDYYINGYQPSKLVKLEILLNGDPVDALSTLTYVDNAYPIGRKMCEKLKDLIPRQQFDVAIQAAIGSKIIARETVRQVRKDVTAKCYGGDITRKRKLLEKQKEGKKRMRQVGNVEVPQSAFLAVLKLD